jgi:hypothetical protein
METRPAGQASAGTVFRVVSGNFLEMYDFLARHPLTGRMTAADGLCFARARQIA